MRRSIMKIDEDFVKNQIIEFMISKTNGNWHEEKTRTAKLHEHGPDLLLTGGKRNSEKFGNYIQQYTNDIF